MPQRTNPFQNLTASLMAAFHGAHFDVQESVLDVNRRTGAVRELDILITNRADKRQRLLVECRDHKRKQNVQWIDELEGKATRLGFSHVAAVSSSGFTKPAIAEGRERGVLTLHLREAERLDWPTWQWGLEEFGLSLHFNPIVRDVQVIVRGQLNRTCSKLTRDDVSLVDARKKSKSKLSEWISGFQSDPAMAKRFEKPSENNAIQHYTYTIPCDPWILLAIEPDGTLFPIEKLVLSVDRINADYLVSMRHYRMGEEKLHVGHLDILGRPSRLVLHERDDNKLQVLIEQRTRQGEKSFTIDQGRSELVVKTNSGKSVVCPVIPAPDCRIHLPHGETDKTL